MKFLKVQNFQNFKKIPLFYNFEILWMSKTHFDWSTQLDILALVGRWASPNKNDKTIIKFE
jgi:hypothetical protein